MANASGSENTQNSNNSSDKNLNYPAQRNAQNKLFTSFDSIVGSQMVSKVKINREYLLSQQNAAEMNTYLSFSPFATFNDLFKPEYTADGKTEITGEKDKNVGAGTPGVRSLFNKAGAVVIGDANAGKWTNKELAQMQASPWRISNNVPLMDNRKSREAIRKNSGCSVKELVRDSQDGLLGKNVYSFSDFMYCKYLGRLSNNYLITLRRFPYPVDDFISSVGIGLTRANPDYKTFNADSLGCLVTWMGTPGNDMASILKYSVSMPFKEQKASFQQGGVDSDAGGGPANAIANAFDPTYRAQYQAGMAGTSVNNYLSKVFSVGTPPYPASQYNNFRDDYSKAYGPVDTIKVTHIRSEDGLSFDQNISITFDYELRSYNGINPRQAMLDLLSNILNVTYSTGTFWGGGYRGGGAHQNNVFANLQIFKARGGFTNFIDAFAQDYSTLSGKASAAIESNGGLLQTLKKLANNLGGMLMSGMLNSLGRPHKALANSLLSPAPIGFWHLTIGNPHHPIMSIGNLVLKNTEIEHYGPLGIDDFPTGLRVKCQLVRGKSRDIRDIEKLYMHGNDRIYQPMGPKIFDMYKHSTEYKSNYKATQPLEGSPEANITIAGGNGTDTITIENIDGMKHVLQKYFGNFDTNSIIIASMEQEYGAHKKKKQGTAGGDSSVQGNKK